jgi:hypothetical protein
MITWPRLYNVNDVRNNQDKLFLYVEFFEDKRIPRGQSVIRVCHNTFALRIKGRWDDREYNDNCDYIDVMLQEMVKKTNNYKKVVLPKGGVNLNFIIDDAPDTFGYFDKRFTEIVDCINKRA